MSRKLKRLSRAERSRMMRDWPTQFLAALLLFGPPPNLKNYDFADYNSRRDHADERSAYFKRVREWYYDNNLSMYERPAAIVSGMAIDFGHRYSKWFEKQEYRTA